MQFLVSENEDVANVWYKIIELIDLNLKKQISPVHSRFFKTSDGIECDLRRADGSLIANCYSESDRMGQRRWFIEVK